MPMEFFNHDGEARSRQSFDSPTVYFDHWAICTFSDDLKLQDRFINAMQTKRGTFILSHTNLAEFTNMSDPRNSDAAEKFLERLMPNIYLTNFDTKEAEAFENQPSYEGQRMWPSSDFDMLNLVAKRSLESGRIFSLIGFISLAHAHREQLSKIFNEVNQALLDAINQLRTNPDYVQIVRKSKPDTNRTKTSVVMGELMRDLILDPNIEIKLNDVVDLKHATLSVSCCDYVLLDTKWERRVRNMRERVSQQGINMNFAKCFKPGDGIKDFLSQLEAD